MIRTPAGFGGETRIKQRLDYFQPSYGVAMLAPETASPFTPAALFAAGEQGVWLDPSDFSTMFQDAAGTTPVTATGQSVLRILDKSGRGNNATQASSGSAPTLQQDANGNYYLNFDGSNDSLQTTSINLTSTNKVSVFAGVYKQSDAALSILCEFSATVASNGTFRIAAPGAAGQPTYDWVSRGTILVQIATTVTTYPAPIANVVTGLGDISGDSAIIRVNGVVNNSSSADQGTGNYSNSVLNIGRRNNLSLPLNGRIYSLIVRGAASSATEITNTETWVNGKIAAY